jgi:hypothetical protein
VSGGQHSSAGSDGPQCHQSTGWRAAFSRIAASSLTLQNPQAHEFHGEAIALLAAISDDIMLLQGVQGCAQSGCRQAGAAGEGLAIGGPGVCKGGAKGGATVVSTSLAPIVENRSLSGSQSASQNPPAPIQAW